MASTSSRCAPVFVTPCGTPSGATSRSPAFIGNSQTQADLTEYQFAYTLDGGGQVVQTDVTNPRGEVRRVTFNSARQWLTDTQALGTALARTATVERQTGTHLVTAAIDGLNRRTEYTYDAEGHMLTTTQLAGTTDAVTTTFTYEPQYGLLASITDPLSQVTTFSYDAQGRLTTVTDPLDQETTFTYDGAGQLLTATDPLSQTTTFGYEVADLVAITDSLGRRDTKDAKDAKDAQVATRR